MKTQRELNEIDIDINFYDNENIVEGFLKYSALNRMSEFDFDAAFEALRTPIEYKLTEHAQNCTLDEFIDYNSELGCHSDSDYEKFTYSTNYINIDIDDVKEAINKMQYEKSQNAFDGMFDHLIELIEKIDSTSNDEKYMQYNVELFDEIIHAQHTSGDIFEDVDIDQIKENLDEEIIEMMEIEVAIM